MKSFMAFISNTTLHISRLLPIIMHIIFLYTSILQCGYKKIEFSYFYVLHNAVLVFSFAFLFLSKKAENTNFCRTAWRKLIRQIQRKTFYGHVIYHEWFNAQCTHAGAVRPKRKHVLPLSIWCSLKGHRYFKKLATFSICDFLVDTRH